MGGRRRYQAFEEIPSRVVPVGGRGGRHGCIPTPDIEPPAALGPDLHFPGVVISDDLGNAKQVADFSPGVPAMISAVLARAATDSAFRAHIDAAALRVLNLKASLHLQAPS
jgi:hypothetical protein